jgi:hypothetical protein
MSNIANVLTNGNAPPFYLVDPVSGEPMYNQDGIVLLSSAAITANDNTDIQHNSFYRGINQGLHCPWDLRCWGVSNHCEDPGF